MTLDSGPRDHDPIEVYRSQSPDRREPVYGRSCGVALKRLPARSLWLLEISYTAGNDFGLPHEKDHCEQIETLNLGDATEAVLRYDMLDHFQLDLGPRPHIAMIEVMLEIHRKMVAAWGREIARFTAAAVENNWDWERMRSRSPIMRRIQGEN